MSESSKTMYKHIHFVGIKGVAMTALAIYCKEKRSVVTGSDTEEQFPTDELLDKAGIIPQIGFSSTHIETDARPDLVIYTGAHNGRENRETATAISLHIPVMSHGEALGMFMDDSIQISVAGSHGKTTTSAMIATILADAGKDPSYAIGCGHIRGLGLSGHFGKGTAFVAEADEYSTDPNHDIKPRFLWQHPDILVVTNIDFDHPDAYKTLFDVKGAFVALQSQQKGIKTTIVNADDVESKILLSSRSNVLTYGKSPTATVSFSGVRFFPGETRFTLAFNGMPISEFTIYVPGIHNVRNAAASALAAFTYGVSWEKIKKGLALFHGTKRRFEVLGEKNGAMIIDDYAHHPKEIQATLAGCRQWYPKKRIIVVFQPHTYSRTKALLNDFSLSFSDAGMVIIPDIYASARETDTLHITGKTVVMEIAKHNTNVYYQKDFTHIKVLLDKTITPDDVVIFMGAGDIYGWGREYVKSENREQKTGDNEHWTYIK